jgi:hypothetical protein
MSVFHRVQRENSVHRHAELLRDRGDGFALFDPVKVEAEFVGVLLGGLDVRAALPVQNFARLGLTNEARMRLNFGIPA